MFAAFEILLRAHQKPAAASPASVAHAKAAARKILAFADSSYEDRVVQLPQNPAKTHKKHLHPRENRTTISGA
ncbi:MAG TPA: hypothetical protein DIT28_16235 [Oxalobacteraceae bacterium]|nr:hypothetical protein [Oxalobacteraceae bacterium]